MIEVSLILTFLGFVMIYLEFFLPGGLFAILGGSLVLLSIILFGFFSSLLPLIGYLIGVIVLLLVLIKAALFHVKKSRKTIYLDDDQQGFLASNWDHNNIGKEGIASSPLNPSGHILVDNEYLQGLSKTGFIKKGSSLKIVGGQGAYYLVELLKKDQ